MLFAIMVAVITIAIMYVIFNYFSIKKMSEGTDEMVEMAKIIRDGSVTFLRTEFKMIVIVCCLLALIFSLFIERTSGLTFLLGSLMSSIVCIVGMKSATYANVRTANKARESKSIGETVKVALSGGSISGLCVQALGLLGVVLVLMIWGFNYNSESCGLLTQFNCNPFIMRLTTYSLGCSVVAMFNRVAGGNYTKAADISSDILSKLRHDMPEDDSRVPNVIADFIGDNVNDIAGNCSDLLESFVATVVSTLMIACTVAQGTIERAISNLSEGIHYNISLTPASKIFGTLDIPSAWELFALPIGIAGVGLLGCVIGLLYARIKRMGDNPAKELDMATWISAIVILLGSLGISYYLFGNTSSEFLQDVYNLSFGWISPWVCILLGIVSGIGIGKITEYYTSADCKPTIELAKLCPEGEAFVVTKGDAIGSKSCMWPILLIGVSLLIAGNIAGSYGIALAALGMLSFVGTTVSIDAFGPIADNAGGLAESCHLPKETPKITDKLDAVGNTTAAIGKGFAIGSAAFATVSLISAYVGNYTPSNSEPILNMASFVVVAGGIIGGALIEYFSAMLTDNTIESAKVMADEGDRQLSIPGVLEGTVKPDYNKCVEMAAQYALKKMLVPSLLAITIPIIGGVIFGVEFVGGILVGATICAIPRAIFMGNSGGAFDNAKKYIESESLEGHGKGSPAHKAAVTGDTIGDTRKDVVGVALDIFIKMMSTVANTFVSVFSHFSLF